MCGSSQAFPVMPLLASVRQCGRLGIGSALSQTTARAGDLHATRCTFWCSAARAESTRTRSVARDESAPHHGFARANPELRCAAIRVSEILWLICRRSAMASRMSDAYELCTVVGSASLYCTISKREDGHTRLDLPRLKTSPAPLSPTILPCSYTTRPRAMVVTGQPVTSNPSHGV